MTHYIPSSCITRQWGDHINIRSWGILRVRPGLSSLLTPHETPRPVPVRLPLQLWITRNDNKEGRANDIRKIHFVHQHHHTSPNPLCTTLADCNCILQYFLIIIKNDLLKKTFHIDRTARNWHVKSCLSLSEFRQKYALDWLSVWSSNLKLLICLICCKPTVKTLILTVCLAVSAVKPSTEDHTTWCWVSSK